LVEPRKGAADIEEDKPVFGEGRRGVMRRGVMRKKEIKRGR
jgi:hypothetical protein